jgi:hypothetical protein
MLGVWIMELRVLSSDQGKPVFDANYAGDCACDNTNLRMVRRYLHERFPDRAVREFHSHSAVVVDGSLPAPYANYHIVSINDERPYYVVLTRGFLEQPVRELREHLRWWDLASVLQVNRTVIIDADGLSPL